jgi:hypothetical protein
MLQAEPPLRIIEPLKTAFQKKGRLDLDDLITGGELNREQIARASFLGLPYFWHFRDNGQPLRFLNALKPIRRRMAQDAGVSFASLVDPLEREWFKAAAWKANPGLTESALGQLVFRIRQAVDRQNTLTISFLWQSPRGIVASTQLRLVVGETGTGTRG